MVLLASRACVSLTACHTPAAFIAAHQGLTFAWLVRVMAQTTKLGAWPGSRPVTPSRDEHLLGAGGSRDRGAHREREQPPSGEAHRPHGVGGAARTR